MSAENVELLRRYYDSWNAGDTDLVVSALAEKVEWHGHPRLPEPGPYGDPEAVGRWMNQFQEAWEELRAEPVELLDAGDGVVALVHMTGRGRGSGLAVQGGVDVHVVGFQDGMVSFFRILPGDDAAELAGLDEREMGLLVLRVQDGLTEEEIAERHGGDKTIPSALAGAYEKLRRLPQGVIR
ncbi:MAG: nuclear transport factor 2 family protein [Solirubrobacterales bacterium]